MEIQVKPGKNNGWAQKNDVDSTTIGQSEILTGINNKE